MKSLGVTHELEFAIDETDKPTTPVEHVVVVSELQRLGVELVSFAPRWVGQFEKGVEYIGSLDELAEDFQRHAEISRALGPYKLSLHSGSDKFSIYPLFAEATRGVSHLKTAGTSWIEALRVVARHEPDLLREILKLSLASFEENRHSYHLSCDPGKIPANPSDDQLDDLVTAVDSRQVMHVGYGAVLERFGEEIKQVLDDHEEELYEIMHQHFLKHVEPFGSRADRTPSGSSRPARPARTRDATLSTRSQPFHHGRQEAPSCDQRSPSAVPVAARHSGRRPDPDGAHRPGQLPPRPPGLVHRSCSGRRRVGVRQLHRDQPPGVRRPPARRTGSTP